MSDINVQKLDRRRPLEKMLAEALEDNQHLRSIVQSQGTNPELILTHSGTGPELVINVGTLPDGRDKSVVLSPATKYRSATVPMESYQRLKLDTDWFELGYLYSDYELQEDNPNLVLDLEQWFEDRDESNFLDDVEEINSPGTLNALYELTEGESEGKYLSLRRVLADRISEVLDIILVEDTYEVL